MIAIQTPTINTGPFRFGGQQGASEKFTPYKFKPLDYITKFLGWQPWAKQREIISAYELALRQLHEREAWEHGDVTEVELEYWKPGQVIQNWLAIDAGHNVGKTKLDSGLVSHFFDCFAPSIIYCFAPSAEQINDLLFKEIRVDRRGKALPGTVLDEPRIKYKANHFVKGKATDNANNTGTERAQGQHGKYLMFVLDEAEGIPGFVWDAVESMASGGIAIILVTRNPRTTTCKAHKIRRREHVKTFRISCLEHPNVLEDREIIPGSVRRRYVTNLLEGCQQVEQHNPDEYTFELPWQPGVIYRPSIIFLWRVLGIASSSNVDDTFCPVGRYEAAQAREAYSGDLPNVARVGVDVARYGNDNGTIYCRHAGTVQRECEISKKDGYRYYIRVKQLCLRLHGLGVTDVQVRVDGGGGYGSTCIDNLNRDDELHKIFDNFEVFEVHNNGVPFDDDEFADTVTEMYYHAGEALKALKLVNPPANLETDLCERKYKYVIKSRGNETKLDLKKLVSKEKFRDDFLRSPDDGDGFVLATAPDRLFKRSKWREIEFMAV